MSDNNNSSDGLNANSVISGGFNRDNKRGERIANASPEAKKQIKFLEKMKTERLEAEHKKQKRYHQYRVNKLKIELLEKHINNPSPRPDNPKAKANDLIEIDKTAQRMTKEREEFFLKNITREADKNIDLTLRQDQQHQKQQSNIQIHDKNSHVHEREH